MEGIFGRPSGVYYARLVVPARLRQIIGKTELVATTGTRNLAIAKIVGGELVAGWRRQIRRAQGLEPMDLVQVSIGSPVLQGDALLPLDQAARESGLEVEQLLRHAVSGVLRLHVATPLVPGFIVPFDSLDYYAETGGYDVPIPRLMPAEALESSNPGTLLVKAKDAGMVAEDLINGREAQLLLLELDRNPKLAFAPIGGLLVSRPSVLVKAQHVELLRQEIASHITAEQLTDARERRAKAKATLESPKRIADAIDPYMTERSRSCRPDQARRIRNACELFAELTGNPRLTELDRDFLRKYRDNVLPRVPANENKIRLQHGTSTMSESIKAAEGLGWPTISERERVKRMQWLCGMFEWLAQEKWIEDDPAVGLSAAIRPRDTEADHAKRDLFTDEERRSSPRRGSKPGAVSERRPGPTESFCPTTTGCHFWACSPAHALTSFASFHCRMFASLRLGFGSSTSTSTTKTRRRKLRTNSHDG